MGVLAIISKNRKILSMVKGRFVTHDKKIVRNSRRINSSYKVV